MAQQLGRHSVGGLYLLAYLVSGALNLSRNQDDYKGGAESGHHEVQTGPQSHLAQWYQGSVVRVDAVPAGGRAGLMKIMSKVS